MKRACIILAVALLAGCASAPAPRPPAVNEDPAVFRPRHRVNFPAPYE